MVRCKIHYPDLNVTQYKNLIDHSIFEKYKIYSKINKDLGKAFIKPYGEYFTDQSPLFDVIRSNNDVLKSNGREFRIELTVL